MTGKIARRGAATPSARPCAPPSRAIRRTSRSRWSPPAGCRTRCRASAGQKVAVLDLLDLEGHEDTSTIPGIPGAARISPMPLRSSAKLRVPADVQMVLCCSSPNQITSARTALSLRRKGISNVWVLEGGLQAWRELDLPVTTELSSPVELAARFGVELGE